MPTPLVDKQAFLDAVKPILVDTCDDTSAFATAFIPRRFDRPFDPPHHEIFERLDNEDLRQVAIAAPRGCGKTTTTTIAFPARKVCFQQCKFIMVVSCTNTIATKDVRNLGKELQYNPKITKIFGPMKGKRWSEGTGDLETANGIHILSRGAGQQIRGLLEETRPDLIIVDDLEDSEPFRLGDPTEYLRKLNEWFYADLMNSIDRRRTRVVLIGTVLHENSLLSNLLEDPDWNPVRLELCDDDYNSKFPNYMSDDDVIEVKRQFEKRGQLDLFYREYRNLAISTEDAIFPPSCFKYYDSKSLKLDRLEKVIIIDPAKTVKMSSAFSAIVCIGYNPSTGIYVLDYVNDRLEPEEIYSTAYEMAVRNRTYQIAVEVTSLDNFITYPLNNYLQSRGIPAVLELKARGKKEERIRGLAPLYRLGHVYHNPDCCEELENQLKMFPRAKFVDLSDALAYCIEIFDLQDFYLGPDDADIDTMQYPDLDDGLEPLGSWRYV